MKQELKEGASYAAQSVIEVLLFMSFHLKLCGLHTHTHTNVSHTLSHTLTHTETKMADIGSQSI